MRDRALAVASLAAFIVFLALALGVTYSPSLQNWDMQAAQWANNLSLGSFLDSVLVGASLYGREYFWIGLVAVLFLFGDRQTKLVAIGLCGVFVVGIVAGELAKEIVARSRPFTILTQSHLPPSALPFMRIPFDTDYSFPSGHAVIVSVGAVYSIVTFRRKWLAVLLGVEAAVVCFSRVYTFEHFPTDVFAGVALGTAVALGGFVVGRRFLAPLAGKVADYLTKLFRNGPLKV